MNKYMLTQDSVTVLLLLIGYLAFHVIAYELKGTLQQLVYVSMTIGSLMGMYTYIRQQKYHHMLICGVIGMITVIAGLDSIGRIL